MKDQAALKRDLKPGVDVNYDEELHERFILFRDRKGLPSVRIAGMLNRSTAAVSQYINKKFVGDLAEFEEDVRSLLRREEDLEFVVQTGPFCKTETARHIWEVMAYCDRNHKMGAVLADSGSGKTETIREYKRQNRASVFVTANISTRSMGSVLRLLMKNTGGGYGNNGSLDAMLEAMIDKLKGSNRLVVVDDAHFLTWEAFELVRKLHDCAKVGVVYSGQPVMYDQMRGNSKKAYLFDQIYSRIHIKRERFPIKKKDVRMIAESRCPKLEKECVDFLYNKARGAGRLRTAFDGILDLAMSHQQDYGGKITVELLMECEQYLMDIK